MFRCRAVYDTVAASEFHSYDFAEDKTWWVKIFFRDALPVPSVGCHTAYSGSRANSDHFHHAVSALPVCALLVHGNMAVCMCVSMHACLSGWCPLCIRISLQTNSVYSALPACLLACLCFQLSAFICPYIFHLHVSARLSVCLSLSACLPAVYLPVRLSIPVGVSICYVCLLARLRDVAVCLCAYFARPSAGLSASLCPPGCAPVYLCACLNVFPKQMTVRIILCWTDNALPLNYIRIRRRKWRVVLI